MASRKDVDVEVPGDPLGQGTSAGTGEQSLEEEVLRAEEQVLKARIVFLSVALVAALTSAIMGITAWQATNSLTVEVDDISSFADAASLLLNIIIERLKVKLKTRRSVLIADFVGGFVSLATLMGVALFGVVNALKRNEQDHQQGNQISNPRFMLFYNIISLGLDALALVAFCGLKNRMEPPELNPDDKLNVVSGLVHMMVDLARGLSVTGTSIYMLYVVSKTDETPWQKLSEKIHGDVFGSFLVCTCVLICVLLLMWSSARTLYALMSEEDEEEKSLSDNDKGRKSIDHGVAFSKLSSTTSRGRGSRDYGSVSDSH